MSDSQGRMYRTLQGFLTGEEPEEENYFCFCATLRIRGQDVPFDEIAQTLNVEPSMSRRKGERKGPNSPPCKDDAWHYDSPLLETEPLEAHINAILHVVRPHLEYLKSLKSQFQIDVFCGYRSNCDLAGFQVSHECLELFTALEIPFCASVIVA